MDTLETIAETAEERAAWFEDLYERLSAPGPPKVPKGTKAADPTRRQRTRRAQLKKLAADLKDAAARLEAIHSDRTGRHAFASLPLLRDKWETTNHRRPMIDARWKRVKEEAAEGCPIAAAFVAEWRELFLLCEHLRHERPPEIPAGLTPQERQRLFSEAAAEAVRRAAEARERKLRRV